MSKHTKFDITDDFDLLDRGMCAALRSKDYFHFLDDVFKTMNQVQAIMEPGQGSNSVTYFLDRNFKSNIPGKNWEFIMLLYNKGLGPIQARRGLSSTSAAENRAESSEISQISDAGDSDGSQGLGLLEAEEQRMLQGHLKQIQSLGQDEDLKAFCRFFGQVPHEDTDRDFAAFREMLEVTSLSIADRYSEKEMILHGKDPKSAMESKSERLIKVKNIFSSGASNIVNGASQVMLDLLLADSRNTRIKLHSGIDILSFDTVLEGIPAMGMSLIIGGTGGGKTLFMSSLAANHVKFSLENGAIDPPKIWGFIGEDGIESYARRIMANVMNRMAVQFGIQSFTLKDMNKIIQTNRVFKDIFVELVQFTLSKTYWLKAPEKPEEKLNFSLINILGAFDAKLDAGAEKPDLLILDYFNLLSLPRGQSQGSLAKDLSTIAYIVDEWAQQRSVAVVTAVQASSGGNQQARDNLKFFELEDQHESKSIAHSSRMVISLLPHTSDYDEAGRPTAKRMGIKVLKNRAGPSGNMFISNLSEAQNIVMAETTLMTESDWQKHKTAINEKRAALFGMGPEKSSYGQKGGFGGPKKGGFNGGTNKSQFDRRGSVSTPAQPGVPSGPPGGAVDNGAV